MRGLERGIERAIGPVTVAAYVEIEAFICFNLVAQMEHGLLDPTPIWTDVKTFPASEFHNKVHILTGGYPCQPFSLAGKRKGVDDERHLYPYIERIIEAVRPPGIFFENVANHLNIGYRQVRYSLEALGYAVEEGIFTAEEVGAPHRRERLFILALAHGSNISRWLHQLRSKELANTTSPGLDRWSREPTRTELQTIERSGETVPDSIRDHGKEIQVEGRLPIVGTKPFSNGQAGRIDRFPAGQGYFQYEWEEPRTVKSSLGSTINGYNFRDDLLRMYGNGVVEQTAELAFITLLNQHLQNLTEATAELSCS